MNTDKKINSDNNQDIPLIKRLKNKLYDFIKNNKSVTIISILLIIVFIWFSIKLRINNNNFNNERIQLIKQYEKTIDSLNISNLEFNSKVFSWAVRSELLRNNTDNINHLLTVFIKESGASLIKIINPENKLIILSSNKKYEGNEYTGDLNLGLTKTLIFEEENHIKIATPIMGLNNIIGVLVLYFYK